MHGEIGFTVISAGMLPLNVCRTGSDIIDIKQLIYLCNLEK